MLMHFRNAESKLRRSWYWHGKGEKFMMKIAEEYIREQIQLLYSKDSNKGYAALKALQDASHEDCMVYTHVNEFFDMLENKNSFVRTRGLVLIAENAIWDEKGIIDRFFESYLQHITDEKPITARQCIKLLPTIAKHKPELKKWMADALHVADLSC